MWVYLNSPVKTELFYENSRKYQVNKNDVLSTSAVARFKNVSDVKNGWLNGWKEWNLRLVF